MKKIFALLLILCLSGCTNTAVAETTTASAQAENPYSDFHISDYYPADEGIKPMAISSENSTDIYNIDSEKYEIALAKLKTTEYYLKTVEQGKEYFTYENGGYIPVEENRSFVTDTYKSYFDNSGEPFSIKPQVVQTMNIAFDGKNTESIFAFTIPLCTELEYDTETFSTYCITIYVNHKGEAILLEDGSAQTITDITPIYFEDNTVHVMFSWGYTMESSRSSLISFDNGKATTEYYGEKVIFVPDKELFRSNYGGKKEISYIFFRDKEKGYCNVKGDLLTGEAADIIRSAEAVLERIPDIGGYIDNSEAYVVCGKYITTPNETFSFEGGDFKMYKNMIIPPPEDALFAFSESYRITVS